MNNRNANSSLQAPPPAAPKITPQVESDLGVAHDLAAATYFQRKLIQPVWKQFIFNSQTGLTINFDWKQPWVPMSVLVVNPNNFPIYVATAGPDATSNGLAFPALDALRIPINASSGLTVSLSEEDVYLDTTQYLVHLFFYPTPD